MMQNYLSCTCFFLIFQYCSLFAAEIPNGTICTNQCFTKTNGWSRIYQLLCHSPSGSFKIATKLDKYQLKSSQVLEMIFREGIEGLQCSAQSSGNSMLDYRNKTLIVYFNSGMYIRNMNEGKWKRSSKLAYLYMLVPDRGNKLVYGIKGSRNVYVYELETQKLTLTYQHKPEVIFLLEVDTIIGELFIVNRRYYKLYRVKNNRRAKPKHIHYVRMVHSMVLDPENKKIYISDFNNKKLRHDLVSLSYEGKIENTFHRYGKFDCFYMDIYKNEVIYKRPLKGLFSFNPVSKKTKTLPLNHTVTDIQVDANNILLATDATIKFYDRNWQLLMEIEPPPRSYYAHYVAML